MSDLSQPPDWLPYALDRLCEVGLDAAADALAWLPTVADLLSRSVTILEDDIRTRLSAQGWRDGPSGHPSHGRVSALNPAVILIAEHRGERVDDTLARLRPARQPADLMTAEVSPSGQSITMAFQVPPDAPYDVYDGDHVGRCDTCGTWYVG